MLEMTVIHHCFVEVTSAGSGGRAKILAGHEFLSDPTRWTDPILTSKKFMNFPVGAHLIVRLSVSPSRRQILGVDQNPEVTTSGQFAEKFKATLDAQRIRHENTANNFWKAAKQEVETSPTSAAVKLEKGRDTWMDTGKVFIRGEDLTAFNAIKMLSERRPTKVLMVGPSGYGKTSVPEALARNWNMDFLRWDCANVRDPEEFFGYREAVDGSTVFVPTEFTKAVRKGNCIIVLDELNRLEPFLSNSLFPMLDHSAKTIVHGEEIKVGENVIFFGTINVGYQFTGTFQLDAALLNRFDIKVSVRPLPQNVEIDLIANRTSAERETAKQIVAIMKRLRDLNANGELNLDASTRVSLQIGDLVGVGLDLRSAFAYAVMNGIEEEESRKVADAISLILAG